MKKIELLLEAIDCVAVVNNGDRVSVYWHDVADVLKKKGASYPFAAMACRNKWVELGGVYELE